MKCFVFNSEEIIQTDDLEGLRLAIKAVHGFITVSPKIKLRMSKNMWREICGVVAIKQLTTREMSEGKTEIEFSGEEIAERRKRLEESMRFLMPHTGSCLDIEICDEVPQKTILSQEDPWRTNRTEPITIVYTETGKEAAIIDNIRLMSG
jgi:hypothetical protein